jgi:hypothetical protein
MSKKSMVGRAVLAFSILLNAGLGVWVYDLTTDVDPREVLRTSSGSERRDLLYKGLYDVVDLKVGMTKEEVAAVLGLPDNTDRTHVWYWYCCADDPSGVPKGASWRDMYFSCPGPYLLFDRRGQLITPHLRTLDEPWTGYYHATGETLSREELQEILGPNPNWNVVTQPSPPTEE